MNIGVLSGKGGAGKTFIATNLARVIKGSTYVDCDIEEPNGHLFFQVDHKKINNVKAKTPVIDPEKCIACGKCSDFCKFNALARIGEKIIAFDDICHSCLACGIICEHDAISYRYREIGSIYESHADSMRVLTGLLNIGEPSGTGIINELIEMSKDSDGDVIIDCPPGSACTVMESIKDADYCILVLEATVFGLENFKMVRELVELFEKDYGVIINKAYEEDNIAREYCDQESIEVLHTFFFDQELSSLNSSGSLITEYSLEYRNIFKAIHSSIREADLR